MASKKTARRQHAKVAAICFLLSLAGSPQAVAESFEDDFGFAHDFIADGVEGTGWDRITGVPLATGPKIEARNGVLHMTSSGTNGDSNPLSIARAVPTGVNLQATVELVDAPSQGDTFDRSYVNFTAPMIYIGRSDNSRGVSHYVSHHFFEAFNLGNGMQVVEDFARTHDGSFTAPPGYRWMRIEFDHKSARVTAFRSQDGNEWEEFGNRTLEALTAANAQLEIGLIHAVWGGNPDPADAYVEWANFSIRELFEDIEITLIDPQDGFSEADGTKVTFTSEITDRGNVGVASVSLIVNGDVISTNTSGEVGIYTFTHDSDEEVLNWEIVAQDLSGASYRDSRTLIRDFEIPDVNIGGLPLENLHRSSRRTGLLISEIMHRPGGWAAGRTLEFVELYNSQPTTIDISGWSLTGAIQYTFPEGTSFPGESFLVVAANPPEVAAHFGLSGVLGGYQGTLDRDDGEVRLLHRNGGILLEAEYGSAAPWPAAAAGTGHSLVLARPSYGEDNPVAWIASTRKGGSPGQRDPPVSTPLAAVKINEFLTRNSDVAGSAAFIELYNHSPETVDISGAYLSDRPDENRFRIPAGTSIPPGGFLAFDGTALGFSLNDSGEAIYWLTPDGTSVIDAVSFGAQADGVGMGRIPDGASAFRRLAAPTPGQPNSPLLANDIVINEIMFNPLSGDERDTYIELFNRGDTAVDVSGWRFTDGIRFTFPENTIVPRAGYLVVAHDLAHLSSRHPNLNAGNAFGNFTGQLSNSGETLALAKPVRRGGDIDYVVTEELTYADGGRWGTWANRDGSSLELRDPRSDNNRASNWTHSDETGKSVWGLVEHTGVLDHGVGLADQLHLLIPSGGECLIDEVQVRIGNGPNLVVNGELESDMNGWRADGHHVTSHWHPEGYQSSGSLRLVADGGGDTGPNRVRVGLTQAIPPGTTVTLSARARWLAGHPQILLRLNGNYLEAMGDMPIPAALGTPGAMNSARIANAGPAIYEARHSPALPAAQQPVTVTARVHDPDGVNEVTLFYRIDPDPAHTSAPMTDDGSGRDAVAGDGLYTATIPGQAAETLVAFYVHAGDAHLTRAVSTYPDDPSNYEALVRFGERSAPGPFPNYHLWFTQVELDDWSARPRLSNRRSPGTLVYGNRVIHNTATRFRGSPWRRPTGLSFQVPRDDRLLGAREFNMNGIHPTDPTAQRETLTYWIAEQMGLPFSHQTYVHVTRNGRSLIGANAFTDIQQIDSEYLQAWFPDDDHGELFKVDDWFEFRDDFNFHSVVDAQLQPYTTTGGAYKKARYRWSWNKRSNRGLDDDYSSFFQLINAANTPKEDFASALASVADVDQWMRTFAMRRIISDWDSYGYNRGKNAWTYKPENGPWKMILWDLDIGLGADNSSPVAPLFGANDPAVVRMQNEPSFRRAYWNAFHDAVHGPLLANRIQPQMDAHYSILTANGFNVTGPQPVKDWVTTRRTYLLEQLATVSADLAVTGTETVGQQVVLTGTAPVHMRRLTLNGAGYPLTWTSETEWTVTMPLRRGQNLFQIAGWGSTGEMLGETSVVVSFSSHPANPTNRVAINEIMYDPVAPETEYVEIHNTSGNHLFDLSGYRLDGLDFTFAPGTLIEPGAFLLVVRNRVSFQNTYGTGLPIAGEAPTLFPHRGTFLRLISPASETAPEQSIDEVYDLSLGPWPIVSPGAGDSFQRIDPTQPAAHPGNWAVASPSPGRPNSVRETLPLFPNVSLNELQPVNTGIVTDAYGESDPWVELYHAGDAPLSLDGFHLSNSAADLARWSFPAGTTLQPQSLTLVWLDGQSAQSDANEWHTHFAIHPENGALYLSRAVNGGGPLVIDAVAYRDLPPGNSLARTDSGPPPWIRSSTPTPAAANASPSLNLLHYWNFNDAGNLLTPSPTLGQASIRVIESAWGETVADDGQDFSGLNARIDAQVGTHLRLNEPLGASITIAAPTTGHRDIVVRYETRRSGQGAGRQIVEYSLDGTTFLPWTTVAVTETPTVQTIDFAPVAGAGNNPNFALRITFAQGDGGTEGNNRFDNLTLEGSILPGERSPPLVTFPPALFRQIELSDPLAIQLSDLFTSTDGHPLAITATTPDTDVVGLSIDGDFLTVSPLMRGEARVTLTADNQIHPLATASFRVLVYPAAHALAEGRFVFDTWSPDEPAAAYPEHMLFLQSDTSDPGIDAPLEYAYRIPLEDAAENENAIFPYRATSRTRLNGLGPDGIAFINTGRGRDLGGALLALNTENVTHAPVAWLVGTLAPNDRTYAIRLQYRLGFDGDYTDVLDENNQPVEYIRNAAPNHVQQIAPVPLPSEALGRQYVQLLWRYYRISGDSGPRAQLRIDDLVVANAPPGSATALAFGEQPPEWSQSGNKLPPLMVSAIDEQNLAVATFEGTVTLALSGAGQLQGQTSAEAVAGVATFPDLSIDGAGPFTLTASATGLGSVESNPFNLVRLTEVIMPRFIQGNQDANGDNNDRVPFAFRLRLDGLIPNAEYRFGNRVVTAQDSDQQDGAGNAILIMGQDQPWVRNTSAPRFLASDYATRHLTFTADATGSHTGWFVTEPSGNGRFTPGNSLFVRLLLNDGNGGELPFHFLTTRQEITVISFGAAAHQGTGITGQARLAPRNFVLLYDNELGGGRPVAATPVEITGSGTDSRYAGFYQTTVAATAGSWGAIFPNDLPHGLQRVEERDLAEGRVQKWHVAPAGFAETVTANAGLNPVVVTIDTAPFTRFSDWRLAMFADPEADPTASGPEGDPSGQGVSNLLRYAFGIQLDENPLGKLPRLVGDTDDRRLSLAFAPERTDIAYLVEASSDLRDWSETIFDSRIEAPATESGMLELDLPSGVPEKTFFRVRVLINE